MALFTEDGHLSAVGLAALCGETLDETGRLEAAEHLSFCNECLALYLNCLDEDKLLQPPRALESAAVLAKAQTASRRQIWLQFGALASAACLAVILWGTGTAVLPKYKEKTQLVPDTAAQHSGKPLLQAPEPHKGINYYFDAVAGRARDSFSAMMGDVFAPAQENTVGEEQQAWQNARKEKEKVFSRPQPEEAKGTP